MKGLGFVFFLEWYVCGGAEWGVRRGSGVVSFVYRLSFLEGSREVGVRGRRVFRLGVGLSGLV